MSETNINDLFRKYVQQYQHATPIKCEVKEINENTITAAPLSGAVELKRVYFNKNFLLKVGSIVYITMLDDGIGFVSQYSELTEVVLVSDSYGGVPIADEVTNEINSLKDQLNELKTAFSSWVTVPNDGGAALKAITASWAVQQLPPTVSKDIQNEKVKHGS